MKRGLLILVLMMAAAFVGAIVNEVIPALKPLTPYEAWVDKLRPTILEFAAEKKQIENLEVGGGRSNADANALIARIRKTRAEWVELPPPPASRHVVQAEYVQMRRLFIKSFDETLRYLNTARKAGRLPQREGQALLNRAFRPFQAIEHQSVDSINAMDTKYCPKPGCQTEIS